MKVKKFLVVLAAGIVLFGQTATSEAKYAGTVGNSSLEDFVLEQMWRRNEEGRRRQLEWARKAEEQRVAQFNSLVAQGDKFYSSKNYSAAIDSYAAAREIHSAMYSETYSKRLDELYINLVQNGDKLNAQGQKLSALDYYKKALTMNYDDKIVEKIGTIFLETFNPNADNSDILNFFKTFESRDPNNLVIKAFLGSIYAKLEDYASAVSRLENVIEFYPENPVVNALIGGCYLRLENYDKAIKFLKKASKLTPNDATVHYYLGFSYAKIEDYKSAKKSFTKAVKLNPNYAEANTALKVVSGKMK